MPTIPFDQWEVILVLGSGTVYAGREPLLRLDDDKDLLQALWHMSRAMSTAPESLDPEDTSNAVIPDDPIAIRADRSAAYRDVLRVLNSCWHHKIMIWKVLIIARDGSGAGEKALPFEYPRIISPHYDYPNGGVRDIASLVVKQRAGDVEIRLWRNWPALEGGAPEEFATSDTAQLVKHLRERALTAPSTRTWHLYAPADANWEHVVRAIDCFVAAGLVALVPHDYDVR